VPLKTLPLEEPSINLTSMLDVVLNLIIFFMISTQFIQEERQYDVKLPTVAEATTLSGQPDEIVVNVLASGGFQVKGDDLGRENLGLLLKTARERFPGQAVIIRADGDGKYQPVMDVLSTCRQAGIRNVSLANRLSGAAPQ
jgi:biopolymer transport protein ExbD